jgi:hypothetical protein
MLLSLLNRESMTRFSVSWQKGHFMVSILIEHGGIVANAHRFFTLELRLSQAVRINWKFFAEFAYVSGDGFERVLMGDFAQRS